MVEFCVLRCVHCKTFQVQQVTKSRKWSCKMCNEKQSILRDYGRGSGADCRRHVQKLNSLRGELENSSELSRLNPIFDMTTASSFEEQPEHKLTEKKVVSSKWDAFMVHDTCDLDEEEDDFGNDPINTDAGVPRSKQERAVWSEFQNRGYRGWKRKTKEISSRSKWNKSAKYGNSRPKEMEDSTYINGTIESFNNKSLGKSSTTYLRQTNETYMNSRQTAPAGSAGNKSTHKLSESFHKGDYSFNHENSDISSSKLLKSFQDRNQFSVAGELSVKSVDNSANRLLPDARVGLRGSSNLKSSTNLPMKSSKWSSFLTTFNNSGDEESDNDSHDQQSLTNGETHSQFFSCSLKTPLPSASDLAFHKNSSSSTVTASSASNWSELSHYSKNVSGSEDLSNDQDRVAVNHVKSFQDLGNRGFHGTNTAFLSPSYIKPSRDQPSLFLLDDVKDTFELEL